MTPTSAPAATANRAQVALAAARISSHRGRLEGVALSCLIGLAMGSGFGDIAQINPVNVVLLNALHGLLALTIGVTLAAAARHPRHLRVPTSVAVPLAVWLGVLGASAAFAPSHRADAVASLSRPISGALLAWSVWQLCSTVVRWRRVVRAFALGGLIVALIALAQASGAVFVQAWLASLQDGDVPIGDVPRVAATLSHPNEAAMLLELSLPLLVAWTWTAPRRWRLVLLLASVCAMLATVLTFSRAGMLAALISLGLMSGICFWSADADRRRNLALTGLVALVVPLGLAWAALTQPGLDRRLLAGLDESSSLQPARTEFWSVAVTMLQDRPLLGVGPDNFRWRFTDYSGVPADNLGIHAHNQYLETLADTGVLGLLSFAWLLVALVRVALQRLHARLGGRPLSRPLDWPWRAALLASLAAWLVHALVDDFERFWPATVAFWLLVGLILAHPQEHKNASPPRLGRASEALLVRRSGG